MVDIHVHILPGLDDGAEDMHCALEMAALAVESGVEIIAATPHSGKKNHCGPELTKAILDFRKALERERIPLKVCRGMEIFGTPEVPALLEKGAFWGLNGSRYPLIEFAFSDYAAQATEILEEIVAKGMRPVVAHPERYLYIQQDPSLLNLWVEMGCLLQINKGSLLGRFGRREELLALELVGRGFAFAVASDAHSPVTRTTWMGEVKTLLREEFSTAAARSLLETNPLRLLKNEDIQRAEPDWF